MGFESTEKSVTLSDASLYMATTIQFKNALQILFIFYLYLQIKFHHSAVILIYATTEFGLASVYTLSSQSSFLPSLFSGFWSQSAVSASVADKLKSY